ncbi:hypothetical protein ASPWEDRAFT_157022 [Aspergillus wentii DTO 134E9]|uniref:Carboxylesterase type B domain-containing protein n=1 Tax=Aspergillus wentii DTO 134E9 TaxID=1073089 RepID=A0A1L9RFT6_ASPWE|nr:uncharacterized protein ASPWEDRAFT_157022 [Aspergillus wentii DTO 134E9]KAI9925508.1 hypothetical protein MW887_005889 [Aspergillus wentii]OJJ33747.1 hypothetical protein ASPWEDRAFT_157022 [Aspergillus wentii DTO 134E9]
MRVTSLLSLAASLGSVRALPSSPSASASASTASVKLDYCTVVPAAGNASLGYYKYQNIRFAAVPTGDLRFAKPEWPSVETAINNGSLADGSVDCSSDEDCLYLDVWAPANSASKKLPVLVWTYGGGFTGGSKSENTPEGLFDLSKDFVFVAYNYRLGFTGLATGPTYEHEGGTSNLALWDSQHAFQWTKKYISAFGGDPEKITAMGFSAGGSEVLFQLTRFAGHAEQLFNQAYIMSPGYVPGAGHHHGENYWQNVSSAVGCDGGHLDCMRQVNFSSLSTAASDVQSTYNYQLQPRVDGDFVADTYEAQLYQGRFNFTGPLVISHEQHEVNGQAYSGINTTADVSKYLRIFFPAITDDVVDRLLELYPESDYSSPGLRFSDMKQSFDLTAHDLAVTHALDNNTWNAMVALGQATHGTDQSYYWYSTYSLSSSSSSSSGGMGGMGGSTSVNSTVARTMQKYLLSFVLTGNPNTKWANDKIYWPKYGSNATQLVFNTTMYLEEDDLANGESLYWNKVLWY